MSIPLNNLHWFIHSGEGWLLRFKHRPFVLADQLGLRYLHELISRPHTLLSSRALLNDSIVAPADMHEISSEDYDQEGELLGGSDVIDEKTRSELLARRSELLIELEDAKTIEDSPGIREIEDQLKALTTYLSKATHAGKRKAFQSLHKKSVDAVRNAIERTKKGIHRHDSDLGKHLDNAVRYRRGWMYAPESTASWAFNWETATSTVALRCGA